MEGTYAIWHGKEKVGQAVVEQHGLYYCFHCQCQLHSGVMCRVTMSCGGIYESLGILAPSGNQYILSKKLPVKQFRSGTPEFWITPKQPELNGVHIDIYPEEPFRYIAKLERAYLDKKRGKNVICIAGDPTV